MNPVWIIQKKRDSEELSPEEIRAFVAGISSGEVADYQASAFLMAVYLNGMSLAETVALTKAMLESGDRYDLSKIPGPKVDKHSTGGVGDKVSLVLAPLAAACGLKVPMMSGRGLGHSGGTLDKLESIKGFNVHLTRHQFEDTLRKVGCAMIGQSERIAPADKKLYALRDVTGTVECIPLIVASILSKKLAEGAQGLVLDVKVGSGAFMKSREDARKLAKWLTEVARKMGLKCKALLTNMDQPLGYAVGHALEVKECIQILRNQKSADLCSSDLKELTIQLCAQMLVLGGISRNLVEGRKLAHGKLADGSAWSRFRELVRIQEGELAQIDEKGRLPEASFKAILKAKKRGYLNRMNTETIGKILVELGGGRKKASDQIDPAVGLIFHRKLGSKLQTGDPIATLHTSSRSGLSDLEEMFQSSLEIGERENLSQNSFLSNIEKTMATPQPSIYQKIREAVDVIQSRSALKPEIGVILGSGLGSLADQAVDTVVIPYTEIPHFHGTSVEGHAGKMVLGLFHGVPVVFLQGRFHLYEGYSMDDVVFPTRAVCGLGIQTLLLTNASGGVNTRFRPGDLMLIEDHLNLMGDNPLKGPNLAQLGPRFPDLSEAYSKNCVEILEQSAAELSIPVHRGVYAGLLGPTYETPAEVRMLRAVGADAVGMSTVPESIAANHLGVRVAGLTCITNLAAGLSPQKLTHQEVIDNSKIGAEKLKRLLQTAIPRLRHRLAQKAQPKPQD